MNATKDASPCFYVSHDPEYDIHEFIESCKRNDVGKASYYLSLIRNGWHKTDFQISNVFLSLGLLVNEFQIFKGIMNIYVCSCS